MVQPVPAQSKGKPQGPSPEQEELMAQRALAVDLEDEIERLQKEIYREASRKQKLDILVSNARATLETESMKWRERYEYPSSSFQSFQEAIDKSAADGCVLEIIADVVEDSECIVLQHPARLLGRLVESRRPVVQCNQLQVKGNIETDVWVTGLEIAGFPMNEELLTNTREMRTIADKYQQKDREALSPGAKMARGVDLRSRSAVLEISGGVEFHISDSVITGAGRNGIEAGGKCNMSGSGLEITNGLAVGISVLDEANVSLERTYIRNCRREGLHLSSSQRFNLNTGSIENCNDGVRILGEQCTKSTVTLGPDVAIRDCKRHGVRVNTGASASWIGGEISGCNSGPVHLQQGCTLIGWQESPQDA
eukprot:gnl/MRDRNA2_/MRDRNA2_107154_c0_seq1.p1 gnl/MRDRNA2_/MRDRNA2_107154_c0~~gnl/MRDRNA2_/MRDRNA2_107154_c0_seq1.p1  ORF type:complete len:366 (+),score=74.30 gnl/MRDRNA2_/MRDRNA2_107154_c0_seq1:61-1158(+)